MVKNKSWQAILGKVKFYILGLILAIFLVFFAFNKHTDISAATFGWIQTSWSGGASTTVTAMHPGNKTGWSFFNSKSSNLDVSNDEMKLQMNSQIARVQTLDADFSAGSLTNSYVAGGKVIMKKPVNATCLADVDCATNYCEPQATTCQVPPVECDGSNGEFICGNICAYKGDIYSTVQIGAQCWFANNLKTTVYPNGTAITKANPANGGSGDNTAPYYSCPSNTDNNAEDCAAASGTYRLGMYYHWNTIMNGASRTLIGAGPRGICPANWHIPSYTREVTGDWDKLITTVRAISGCNGKEATCLKAGGSTGFNALLAGYRMPMNGWYVSRNSETWLWSSSNEGWGGLAIKMTTAAGISDNQLNDWGLSVRCVHN